MVVKVLSRAPRRPQPLHERLDQPHRDLVGPVVVVAVGGELAVHGVTVNAVAPGPVATTMITNYPQALRALVPVGRMGTLDDVIDAVLFLLSERCGYITGEVLDVNGGMWCD